jgi:chromate reductase, NAD(P)H dehydrogenase (quinone)
MAGGSQLAQVDGDGRVIAHQLGHTNLETTERYIHLAEGRGAEAAAKVAKLSKAPLPTAIVSLADFRSVGEAPVPPVKRLKLAEDQQVVLKALGAKGRTIPQLSAKLPWPKKRVSSARDAEGPGFESSPGPSGDTVSPQSVPRKWGGFVSCGFCGAGNGVRTHDPQLGKLMLYQLSYARPRPKCHYRTPLSRGLAGSRCGVSTRRSFALGRRARIIRVQVTISGVTMTKIVGIAGSLRQGSYNRALLRAAVEATPPGSNLEIASIRDIPLYDGDVEAQGAPTTVSALKGQIVAADALLIVTPEYNNSIPGVLKNVIDWLSRPSSDIGRVFENRPVALMGATPGRGGTLLAQTAWLPVLRTLGMRPWFGPRIAVSEANRVFDPAGQLLDEQLRSRLQAFMLGFAEFASQQQQRRSP